MLDAKADIIEKHRNVPIHEIVVETINSVTLTYML